MLVGGPPANWSNNCTQTLTEKAPFHVSAKYVLRSWAQRSSLFLGFAKRWVTASEIARRLERNAGTID
jgi:hypothetical protein